jgi:hypothetical protein
MLSAVIDAVDGFARRPGSDPGFEDDCTLVALEVGAA